MGLKITHLMMFDCGKSAQLSSELRFRGKLLSFSSNIFLFCHVILLFCFCSIPFRDVVKLYLGLQSLMPNSLSALAGSLKHLVLSNNKLQAVPTYALRQLRELDHINLNQNNISVIKEGAFWGLSKVRDPLLPLA